MLLALESSAQGGLSSSLLGPLHVVSAAADALAAYLREQVPQLVDVLDDFPEHANDLVLEDGPIASISTGRPTYSLCATAAREEARLSTGDLQVVWRLGYWSVPMQVDVWCPYKAQRAEIAHQVEAALLMQPGTGRAGLTLTAERHYGRQCTFDLTRSESFSAPPAATRGEWRHMFELDAGGDMVAIGEAPRIAELLLSLTTTLDGLQGASETATIIARSGT